MIRDRIVVGIRDEAMFQKLQLDADLTLESAKKMVRQREAVRDHQVQLSSGSGLPVAAIGNTGASVRSQKFNRRAKPFSKTTDSARAQPTTRNKRTRCCKGLHSRQGCPAKEATCHRCKKGTTSPSVFPTYRRSLIVQSSLKMLPFWMQSLTRQVALHGMCPFW